VRKHPAVGAGRGLALHQLPEAALLTHVSDAGAPGSAWKFTTSCRKAAPLDLCDSPGLDPNPNPSWRFATQLAELTPEQIAAMTPEQLACLSAAHFAAMSAAQLAAITPEKLKAMEAAAKATGGGGGGAGATMAAQVRVSPPQVSLRLSQGLVHAVVTPKRRRA